MSPALAGASGEHYLNVKILRKNCCIQPCELASPTVPPPTCSSRASATLADVTTLPPRISRVRTTPEKRRVLIEPFMPIRFSPAITRLPFGSTSMIETIRLPVMLLVLSVWPEPLNESLPVAVALILKTEASRPLIDEPAPGPTCLSAVSRLLLVVDLLLPVRDSEISIRRMSPT